MTVHNRRLKTITLAVDDNSFDCQVQTWNFDPGEKDGEIEYTFCSAGEGQNSFIEETDQEPTLELKFFDDWRSDGISDFLWTHKGETVGFVLDHHPDIAGEHRRITGDLVVKPHAIGGDARATEMGDITLQVLPGYADERIDS